MVVDRDRSSGPSDPARWILTDAHVLARREDGGVEAIHFVDVRIEEGREEMVADTGDERFASTMRYYCAVRPHDAGEADAWVGSDAFVTIVGTASNGSTVTLSGDGIFGRTGPETFEVEYVAPPGMTSWRSSCGGP